MIKNRGRLNFVLSCFCYISGLAAVSVIGGCQNDTPPARPTALLTSVSSVASLEAVPQPRDYSLILQQLYIAYFGRPADPAGLDYYAKHLAANKAPTHIDSYYAAYSTDSVVKALMDGFGNSDESKSLYPGDTSVFVTAIYRNVLNREPDSAGLQYWVNAINTGALSKGNAALSLMASALSGGTTDAKLVRNKVAAGSAFTSAMNSSEKRAAYAGEVANAQVRNLFRTITATSDLVELQVDNHAMLAQLIAAKQGVRVFHGTVARGNPVKDAIVEVFDQNGKLGTALTDLNGNYMLLSKPVSELVPPFVVKAEFEAFGHTIDLFSIENSAPGLNMKMNVTPLTDMITRGYSAGQGKTDPLDALQDSSPTLTTVKNIARGIFGPLLPSSLGDPVRDRLVPNPQVSEWDAFLESIKITATPDAAVIKDTNDRVMASVPLASLANPAFVPTDATSVTAAEAAAAIVARGALPTTPEPHVNRAAGALAAPADFRATQTGPLTFKLSWGSIPDAERYHIYEQVDAPPTISAGTYAITDSVPSYATGGNQVHDLELEYRVPASGTYYWVLAAVAKDGSVTHYTLGTTTEPVSITFDSSKNVRCETTPLSNGGNTYRCFYETGTAPFTSRVNHGTYRVTGSDGKLVFEGQYTDGKESGVWKYYANANGTSYVREEIRYVSPGLKGYEATYDGDYGGEWNRVKTYQYKSGTTTPDIFVKSTCGNYAPYAANYGTVYSSYRQGSLLQRLDEYKLTCPSGYVGGTNSLLDCCRKQ